MQITDIEWSEGLTFKAVQTQLLKSALRAHNFDIKKTAESLGICRANVYKKATVLFGKTIMELRQTGDGLPKGIE